MYVSTRTVQCVVHRRAVNRLASAKYRASRKGAANHQRNRARRLFVGGAYHSRATSVEQATQINGHIRRRLSELKPRFEN
jgi:hypothetical protein